MRPPAFHLTMGYLIALSRILSASLFQTFLFCSSLVNILDTMEMDGRIKRKVVMNDKLEESAPSMCV